MNLEAAKYYNAVRPDIYQRAQLFSFINPDFAVALYGVLKSCRKEEVHWEALPVDCLGNIGDPQQELMRHVAWLLKQRFVDYCLPGDNNQALPQTEEFH